MSAAPAAFRAAEQAFTVAPDVITSSTSTIRLPAMCRDRVGRKLIAPFQGGLAAHRHRRAVPDETIRQQGDLAFPSDRTGQQRRLIVSALEQATAMQRHCKHNICILQEGKTDAHHVHGENTTQFGAIAVLEWQDQTFCLRIVAEGRTRPRERRRGHAACRANAIAAALRCMRQHDSANCAAWLGDEPDMPETVGAEHVVRENELVAQRAARR